MADNCNPKYKNLNRIQSFSEQRYATVQLMQQACMNDEYLKQKVDELTYLSPPAVRKTFTPIDVDSDQSWGYQINTDNTVSFNSSTSTTVYVDFTEDTMKYVDMDQTTADIKISTDDTGYATVPMVTSSSLNTNVSDWDARAGTNEFWYVGYDKSKTYQIVPEWSDDIWRKDIPSVCRAQTFKVTDLTDGYDVARLEAIVIRLQYGGSVNSQISSPLYVQIRKTHTEKVERYKSDGETSYKKFKFESYSPKQYDTIQVPDSDPSEALATAVYYPKETTPGNITITFDNPPVVEEGETYAVVFASPLANYSHAPRIGGWGRKCDPDPYEYGYAFISENNGYKWDRYGKDDYTLNYRFGKRWPRDFSFRCHIVEYTDGYDTDNEYCLALKPIHTNPIKNVQLSSYNHTTNFGTITYEVSNTGHPDDWIDVTETRYAEFEPDEDGNYPNILFVRAKLQAGESSANPYINNIRLGITTTVPDEMYVRTNYYYPITDPMLGANMWGRVYAPFTTEPSTDCSVEIISNQLSSERFTIINPINLPEYTWIDGLDEDDISDLSEDALEEYLSENSDIVDLLAENNVYVIGFITSFQLNNKPAYPLQGVYLQPANPSLSPFTWGEWYDYTYDYDEDTLTLHDSILEDQLIQGTLKVDYNPVFVDELSISEVGQRINDDTGLVEEGLILDYFSETFTITDTEIDTRTITLRVSPVDPIRSVILNKDTDDEATLVENVDFTVDADNKSLIFEIVNSDGVSSRLSLGDTLTVVYTPNLTDAGISLGYHATRTDTKKDVIIEPNYFEYKV